MLLVFTSLLLASHRASAALRCLHASTPVEKLICNSYELSALDDQLNGLYRLVMATAKDPRTLQGAQHKWLKEERDACVDADCAKGVMRRRIAELYASRLAAEGVNESPLSEADRSQACDSICARRH